MTMMQSHRRALLSLRRQFLSTIIYNPPISRSSSAFHQRSNPNSPFSFSTWAFRPDHRRFRFRCLISCNSPPLTPNWSFQVNFNGVRSFATRLGDSNNRPPKETIMLAGCDWEHWLVVVEAPDPKLTRDEIIDGYIKTLAHVVGSDEGARMKIYSVSTRHYYAFGALLSEELAYKLKDLPHVRWVLPDSYLDVKNKTYAGEPFINGQAVPYDPKYHEIWVRNHEASLKSNIKNKKRQRDPNSSHLQSRSPPSVSSPSTSNESSGTGDHAPQVSNVQIQQPRHSSLSFPSVSLSQKNEMPSGHTTNQTPQTSQIPNPAPHAFSQSQGSQYSQMQNQSSPWAQPPCKPSAIMDHNHLSWGNQNQNWTPVVGSQNQAGHPSQVQNLAPQAFPDSQAPQYSQMQNRLSRGTLPSSESSATIDPNHQSSRKQQNFTPVLGFQNQSRPSQMQNPAPLPHPLPTVDSNYQSWGKQNENLTPFPGSCNQDEHLYQPRFSQSHAPEYSKMQNHSSPGAPLPSELSATLDQKYQNWSSRNRTVIIDSQIQAGHPTPAFSQNETSQYSQIQNHSSPWSPAPPSEPSATVNPNPQSWSSQNQNWTHVSRSDNQTGNPSQWQNQRNLTSPNPYSSEWNSPSQSWETVPRYQSQSIQPASSPHNFSNDNLPPPALPRTTPSHMQGADVHRGSIQSQVQQNGYSYGNRSHNTQNDDSQYGYPSHATQQQYQKTFQDMPNTNAVTSPQGWNHQNMTPPMQNNIYPSTNTRPQVQQNHQFQCSDMTRSMHSNNSYYRIGQADQQVYNYPGRALPSYNGMETVQTREYQERDMPMDEEYMYGSK